MSQAGILNRGVFPPGSVVETIQGNTGGPVGPDGTNNIHVVGDGTTIEVAGNPGTHTLTISTADAVAIQYTTDAGVAVPVAGNLNVFGGTAARDINTSGSGDTIHVDLNNSITLGDLAAIPAATDAITLVSGDLSLDTGNINFFVNSNPSGGSITLGGAFMTNFGANSVTLGTTAGGSSTFAATSVGNVAIGEDCLFSITNTQFTTAVGYIAQELLTSGVQNSSLGASSLGQLLTGSNNSAIGFEAGNNYTGAESNNVAIVNLGVLGDSGVIRIGTNGTQTSCYIAGIDAVNVGSVATVVTEAGDKLGTAVITAGTGITVTPGANTITIASTGGGGTTTLTVTSVNHAASPYTVLTTDSFLAVDVSGGVVSILLPNAPATGRVFYIKDSTGNAAISNITVTTVGGAVNIDGATSFVMNTAYESINVIFDGVAYEVF